MRGGEQARNTLPVSCDGKQNHICCWLFESQRDGLSRAPIFVPVASILLFRIQTDFAHLHVRDFKARFGRH